MVCTCLSPNVVGWLLMSLMTCDLMPSESNKGLMTHHNTSVCLRRHTARQSLSSKALWRKCNADNTTYGKLPGKSSAATAGNIEWHHQAGVEGNPTHRVR